MLNIAVAALGLILATAPQGRTLLDLSGEVLEVLTVRDDAGTGWIDAEIGVDDGRKMRIRLAPAEVLRRSGFGLDAGDRVRVRAFEAGDPHEVHRITNETTGRFLRLRCLHGDPIWDTPRGRHGRGYGRRGPP